MNTDLIISNLTEEQVLSLLDSVLEESQPDEAIEHVIAWAKKHDLADELLASLEGA